ncbi:dihydroorotase [Bacterioplanoides sp.]|uniref:dihydroorotase n=1 Tax=Bacterioplanoides sp. TaxID=2066072 RepID=UPI003B001684
MRYCLIEGARLLDPANNLDTVADVYIADGKIQAIGHKPAAGEIETSINGTGKLLIPGLIDLGAHLAEPGFSQKGSIATETKAAARSGFTHICALPDTKPVTDSSAVVQLIQEKAAQAGYAEVLPLGAATQGLQGEQLANMFSLTEAGCPALSNARQPIKDSYVLQRVMEYAATYGIRLFLSANDTTLADGCMHAGPTATRMGLDGIAETAETIALSQILLMAEQTGVQLHISQISCARSVTMLQQARDNGINVTADVPLANLVYTDEAVNGYNSQFNVLPVLRSETDRQALLAAVNNGELAISSNHRPHEIAAKKAPFSDAEPGMSLFDCFLPLALKLIAAGELEWNAFIKATSQIPAAVIDLAGIGLAEGNYFNAALVDAGATADLSQLYSKGENIPCADDALSGVVDALFVNGAQVL